MRQIQIGDRVYLGGGLPLYPTNVSPRTEWIVCLVEGDGEDTFLTVTRANGGYLSVRRWPITNFKYVLEPEISTENGIKVGEKYGKYIAVAVGFCQDFVLCYNTEKHILEYQNAGALKGDGNA